MNKAMKGMSKVAERHGTKEMSDKAKAKSILGEYTKEMYIIDIVCFWVGGLLLAACAVLLVQHMEMRILPHVAIVSVLGLLTADVATGMVHWLADTYGSVDLPIIGKTLLRPFRYHHVDPVAMCRGSIYQTSGSNHMAVSPHASWLLYCLYEFKGAEYEELSTYLYYVYLFVTMTFIAFTNLFHRWSHMHKPPKYVSFLQATPFVISKAHHRCEKSIDPDIARITPGLHCCTSFLVNEHCMFITFLQM